MAALMAEQADAPGALGAYYASPAVRARIAQYCGARSPEGPWSALSLAGYGGRERRCEPDGAPVAFPGALLTRVLDEGADICRSLADREGTLLQLDIDSVNHDDPAEPYRDPARTFARLEPVFQATREVFTRYGLRPAVLMTGRGYHFTVRAPLGSPFHVALAGLAPLSDPLRAWYAQRGPGLPATDMGRAHDGAGRLLGYLAHEVVRLLGPDTPVPVALIDLPPPGGGPFICLDLTAYGDPLFARYARCAFSGNQKPWMQRLDTVPSFLLTVPRGAQSLPELLRVREDPARAAEMAAAMDVAIPDVLGGVEWVEAYRSSALAAFHRDFDRGPRMAPAYWTSTYDALDLHALPACVRLPLDRPNPFLLVPGWLRSVALGLWGLGWHPRSVSTFVRSRYERPYAWGATWKRYEPGTRADFYVRVCCGAVADGLEHPQEFTCASQEGRGLCPRSGCGFDLARLWPLRPHTSEDP
jgi:hypothetical protein